MDNGYMNNIYIINMYIFLFREHAPSIIFMDEIDSIGSSRIESGVDTKTILLLWKGLIIFLSFNHSLFSYFIVPSCHIGYFWPKSQKKTFWRAYIFYTFVKSMFSFFFSWPLSCFFLCVFFLDAILVESVFSFFFTLFYKFPPLLYIVVVCCRKRWRLRGPANYAGALEPTWRIRGN